MNQAYAGSIDSVATKREPTINERLNRISERMQGSCERVENVLARVHGNPPKPSGSGAVAAQITPTLPLATIVEHLEAVQARMADLASSVERIA